MLASRLHILKICCLCLLTGPLSAAILPVHLTCEYKTEPLGIDVERPRFGWWIDSSEKGTMQAAYEIHVATAAVMLDNGKADVWSSGKISSDANYSVIFSGAALRPARRYYWRVRIWDVSGKVSGWSAAATFVTGLFTPGDWQNTRWIAYEVLPDSLRMVPGVHGSGDQLGDKLKKRAVNPFFRKAFRIRKEVAQAYVFVSGLGQYELYLNGEKVSSDVLSPGWSTYEKRVLYNTYDVTQQLKNGENVLGSIVGPGFFYVNRERYRKFVGAHGYPMFRLLLMVQYTDGTTEEIETDQSWKTAASPITYAGIYGGEDYDARLEQAGWNEAGFEDTAWKPVQIAAGPLGNMRAEQAYPVRIMDTLSGKPMPTGLTGRQLIDFGQNASGIIRLRVQGKEGDTVRITPGEMLDDQGMVSQTSSGGPYYFEYVLKGGGIEEWMPRFTYYGFRYAAVDGAVYDGGPPDGKPSLLSLDLLHTRNSAPRAGTFSCSSPLFNEVFSLIDWALRSNIASVSTDCPHREKMGWLEQAHLMGESLKYNYDIAAFYNKVLDDIIDTQQDNGMVPSVAPEYVQFEGPFRDDPGYGVAAMVVPWYLYQWYGDKQALTRAYPLMKRYVSYLQSQSKSHILNYGLGDWLDLGPNSPGVSQLTPIALSATAFYFQAAQIMSKTALLLEKNEDAATYEALATHIKAAFNDAFYHPDSHVYGTGSQTSYAMALYFGMVDDPADRTAVLHNLTDSLSKYDLRVTAGDIGHRFLVKSLEEAGESSLLFAIHHRDDVPGYGQQIKTGSTALAEHWSGSSINWLSQNHMIFGHLMEWFYSGLAGIRQQDGDAGFKKVLIAPQFAGDITWVKSTYESMNGPISVNWTIDYSVVTVNVKIPANGEAEVVLPVQDANMLAINGYPLSHYNETIGVKTGHDQLTLTVKPGFYQITWRNP